jgi:hypothetical protein
MTAGCKSSLIGHIKSGLHWTGCPAANQISPIGCSEERRSKRHYRESKPHVTNYNFIENAVFCDVTPCGSCENWRFGGTRHEVPPKFRFLQEPNGVTSQKTAYHCARLKRTVNGTAVKMYVDNIRPVPRPNLRQEFPFPLREGHLKTVHMLN